MKNQTTKLSQRLADEATENVIQFWKEQLESNHSMITMNEAKKDELVIILSNKKITFTKCERIVSVKVESHNDQTERVKRPRLHKLEYSTKRK